MGGRGETARLDRGIVLVLLAAVLLVGCLGGSDGAELQETADAAPASSTPEVDDPANVTAARLQFEGPSETRRVQEQGTFSAGDGAFAGGSLRGTDTREHDLTSEVPVGAPVSVNVTIQYEGEASQLDGELVVDGVDVYVDHAFKSFDTNTIWLEALLARPNNAGSVAAVVQADTTGEAPERSYTLDARVRSVGHATLPLVPTAVPVTEETEGFTLEAEAELPAVSVWGPRGERHERIESPGSSATFTLGEEDPPGEYVAVVGARDGEPVPLGPVRVAPANASAASPGDLGLAGLVVREGDWHDVDAGGETNWTFERDVPPVRAGVRIRPSQGFGASVGLGESWSLRLDGPAGPVVEAGGPTVSFLGTTSTWGTGIADESLVAGTYEARASAGAGTSYEAAHVLWELEGR